MLVTVHCFELKYIINFLISEYRHHFITNFYYDLNDYFFEYKTLIYINYLVTADYV